MNVLNAMKCTPKNGLRGTFDVAYIVFYHIFFLNHRDDFLVKGGFDLTGITSLNHLDSLQPT